MVYWQVVRPTWNCRCIYLGKQTCIKLSVISILQCWGGKRVFPQDIVCSSLGGSTYSQHHVDSSQDSSLVQRSTNMKYECQRQEVGFDTQCIISVFLRRFTRFCVAHLVRAWHQQRKGFCWGHIYSNGWIEKNRPAKWPFLITVFVSL